MSENSASPPSPSTVSETPAGTELRFKVATAAAVSAIALTATLIACDLIGADGFARIGRWFGLSEAAASPFEIAQELTFFGHQPIDGSALKVTTGIAFKSVADLNAGKAHSAWCYISTDSSSRIAPHISLGAQRAAQPPLLATAGDFKAEEVARFGFTPDQLAGLARTHCRFGQSNPLAREKRQQKRPRVETRDA